MAKLLAWRRIVGCSGMCVLKQWQSKAVGGCIKLDRVMNEQPPCFMSILLFKLKFY